MPSLSIVCALPAAGTGDGGHGHRASVFSVPCLQLSWALDLYIIIILPQQANFGHVQNLHCVTQCRSASSPVHVGRFTAAQFVRLSDAVGAVIDMT